ncbi:hypothetical protein [Nocardia sp. NPDC051570]
MDGLRVSLNAAAAKLAGLDRMRDRQPSLDHETDLGIPVIGTNVAGSRP